MDPLANLRQGQSAAHKKRVEKNNDQGRTTEMRVLLIAALAVATAFGSVASAAPSGTFRQAHELGFGDKSSLDPISKGRVFQITEKIMSRLVRPDLQGKPSPDLAVSWSANSDATVWTFKLREGVKFHN